MMYWRKSVKQLVLMVGVLFLPLSVGVGLAEVVDRVVARVNGDIITLSMVQERSLVLERQLNASGAKVDLSKKEIMKQVLNSLIEEKLQIGEAKKSRLEVDEKSITSALDDIKSKNNITEAELESMLQQEGRTLEQYKDHIRDQILLSKVVRFHMGNGVKVSKKQIRKYYQSHLKDYWVPKQPFVRHILLIAEEGMPEKERQLKKIRAKELLRQIRGGKAFVEIAKKYSEDVSAASGGEVGFIKKGQLVPEFEETAFRLQEGEVSDVVETQYGFHIIKVDKVIPARTKSLDEVKDEIANIQQFENQKKHYKEWMDEIKKAAFIEIHLFEPPAGEKEISRQATKETEVPAQKDDFFSEPEKKYPQRVTKRHWEEASNIKKNNFTSVSRGKADFQLMERKLSYIKKLRMKRRISETEYQKRKRRLLDQL
ncbi:MAG: peptidylprolyl isomerase [Nitrospinaceae bacterium]